MTFNGFLYNTEFSFLLKCYFIQIQFLWRYFRMRFNQNYYFLWWKTRTTLYHWRIGIHDWRTKYFLNSLEFTNLPGYSNPNLCVYSKTFQIGFYVRITAWKKNYCKQSDSFKLVLLSCVVVHRFSHFCCVLSFCVIIISVRPFYKPHPWTV